MSWLNKTAFSCVLGVLVFAAPAPQTSSPTYFPFAYVQRDCTPTDGVGLNFYFTSKKSECGKYNEPFVEIYVWENPPKSAPYSIELSGHAGGASRCLKSGICEAAVSAKLHLSRFNDGDSASGDYELHFKDGSVEKGKFDAAWCRIKFICG